MLCEAIEDPHALLGDDQGEAEGEDMGEEENDE